MKRFWIPILIISIMLIGAQFAMAGGIEIIPGSRDKDGSLGVDGKSWENGFINSVCSEGATSDAYETCIEFDDPSADNVIVMPDSSGTLSLVGGAGGTLADTKLYIGNSGGLATAQTVSGLFTITNAGVATGTLADTKVLIGNSAGTANAQSLSGLATISNAGVLTGTIADAKVWIGNSAGTAIAVTPSGDWTITNAGVASLAANSVGPSQAFINAVDLVIAATGTGNTVTVDTGHQYMGYYLSTTGGINGANLVNAPEYLGSGVWQIEMLNATSAISIYTLVFLSDN